MGECMEPLTVVLYHSEPGTSRALADGLAPHFRSIHVAQNSADIHAVIARYRAEVLVLDLESLSLDEVQNLHVEFPGLIIVCTHRLADEGLWAEALRKGASDMCEPRRTDEVVASVMRERAHQAAA